MKNTWLERREDRLYFSKLLRTVLNFETVWQKIAGKWIETQKFSFFEIKSKLEEK